MDPFLIDNIKVVIQQKIQPVQNHKLCTWIQIHKYLIIHLHSKLPLKNIWMKLLNHKNNYQKFSLWCKIILLLHLKSFQCKYKKTFLIIYINLVQYCTNCILWYISCNSKFLILIWLRQNWSIWDNLFEKIKKLVLLFASCLIKMSHLLQLV